MKEKIILCLALATFALYSQDIEQATAYLDSLAQNTNRSRFEPEMPQATNPMSDMSQDQVLQDLLNTATEEDEASLKPEDQFFPDRFQLQDLDALNAPDVTSLSDISDEDLIKLIEALSEQPDFQQFQDVVQ